MIAVCWPQAREPVSLARDRERFVLDSNVREWSHRITEISLLLEQLPTGQRDETIARLKERGGRFALRHGPRVREPRDATWSDGPLLVPPPDSGPVPGAAPRPGEPNAPMPAAVQARAYSGHSVPPRGAHRSTRVRHRPTRETFWPRIFIQLPFASNVQEVLAQELRGQLGKDYEVDVQPAAAPEASVIPIPSPYFGLPDAAPHRVV